MTTNNSFSIGLFYGSTTCYTEMAAEKIQAFLNELFEDNIVHLHNIATDSLNKTANYDVLILGISTWDFGELQEDWESNWDDAQTLPLAGKTVALFGMGDQQGYADWFQDALGMLHDAIKPSGCKIVGFWPTDGYEFSASRALTDDGTQFVGLALDDENQYEQSDERIAKWCTQIIAELSE